MRILVIGKTGQVARSLKEGAAARDNIEIDVLGRPELDLARGETIGPAIERRAPDLVVNAAAYNAVDLAEIEPDINTAVNATAPGLIAAAAARLHVPVVHFSTDYVFDGAKGCAYVESDATNPLGAYGRAKLEGEARVAAANPRHLILRTAWVFSPFGQNFVALMLRLAREREKIQVVADQTGSPTYAPDLAAAVLSIAAAMTAKDSRAMPAGTYHLAGRDAVTRYDFARRILAAAAAWGAPQPNIEPVGAAQFPAAAVRPTNSSLDSSRIGGDFGLAMAGLDDALARCMERIFAPAAPSART